MLQSNPMVAKIRHGLTRRVLEALAAKAKDEPEAYAAFWDQFGAVLKEGLYEDAGWREQLTGLLRFRSSTGDGLADVEGYVARMKPGQEAIFYVTGDDPEAALRSPHLEGFRAKGVEVAVLTDPVDEFWVGALGELAGKPLKSVTRAGADLAKIAKDEGADGKAEDESAQTAEPAALDGLIAALKAALGDQVKDVRRSDRLTESAVCLAADEGDLDLHLERLLKQHRQLQGAGAPRVLEINPDHALIRRLADKAAAGEPVDEMAHLLLDQARIVEGEPPADPAAFARRLADAVVRGLG